MRPPWHCWKPEKIRVARYHGSDTLRFDPTFTHINSPGYGSGFAEVPKDYIQTVIAPKIKEDWEKVGSDMIASNFANGIPRIDYKNDKVIQALVRLTDAIFVDETGKPTVFFDDEDMNMKSKLLRLKNILRQIRIDLLKKKELMKLKGKTKDMQIESD